MLRCWSFDINNFRAEFGQLFGVGNRHRRSSGDRRYVALQAEIAIVDPLIEAAQRGLA